MSTLRAQWAALPDGKLCSGCHTVRPKTDFHKHKQGREGLSSQCRFCAGERARRHYEENHEHVRAYKNKWNADNREHRRAYYRNNYLQKKYDMSLADKMRMHAEQGGRCKCCGEVLGDDPRKWYIDHNHDTNKVRGLVCHYCNTGLGMFGDDVAKLRRALAYLEENDG